jgi:hypothetical protein
MKKERSFYLGTRHEDRPVEPGTPYARQLDIDSRAYEIWEEQGRPMGQSREHWFMAEKEFEEMVEGW